MGTNSRFPEFKKSEKRVTIRSKKTRFFARARMKLYTLNKFLNPVLLVLFLGIIFSAIILEVVLPRGIGQGRGPGLHLRQGQGWRGGRNALKLATTQPGSEQNEQAVQNNRSKTFLSMGRHDWAEIHGHFAGAFILGILLHLVLNWNWIHYTYFSKKKNPSNKLDT
jgi:hypothetical protein